MASKFAQFLDDNKIDPRRLLAASKKLEQLRPEDRAIRLAKRRARSGEAPAAAPEGEEEAKTPPKPRSGRPVTHQLLETARRGDPVAGPAKQRLLRALNHLLGQKKKKPVDLRALF